MNSPFQDLKKLAIATLKAFVIVFLFFLLLFFSSCATINKKAINIPQEPTIWIVSEADAMEYKYGEGLMFYKITPINPGQLNVRTVWIRDYEGVFQVGDRVAFEILQTTKR